MHIHLHMLQNIESKKMNENTIVNNPSPHVVERLLSLAVPHDRMTSGHLSCGSGIKMDTKWRGEGTNLFLLYLVYEDMLDSI